MRRIAATIALLLLLVGEVVAGEGPVSQSVAGATAAGAIGDMRTTVVGDTVNVAAQPTVTPLTPAPLPHTPLHTGGGLPAFAKNMLAHLGARAQCASKSYRQHPEEPAAIVGKSGKTVIIITKFGEQLKREAAHPNILLDAISPARFTTTPLKERACIGTLMVISLKGAKPDGGTVDTDIDAALFSSVRGVEESEKVIVPQTFGSAQTFVVDASSFNIGAGAGGIWEVFAKVFNIGSAKGKAGTRVELEVGYSTLITMHSAGGVTIHPIALQVVHEGKLFVPPGETASQKPIAPPPPKAEAPAEPSAAPEVIASAPSDADEPE